MRLSKPDSCDRFTAGRGSSCSRILRSAASLGLLLGVAVCASQSRASAPTAVRLTYQLTPGQSYRYAVRALFSGHFPPFAQPDSKPIHILVDLEYVATVKKAPAPGEVLVDFVVDSEDLNLLESDPGPDGKIDPDTETPFPLPLSQVQSSLNATATMRPDGSVASIAGGSNNAVKIDIGFDLRKLFLVMMPVTFRDAPVSMDSTWPGTDGLLGHKPGATTYSSTLLAIQQQGSQLDFKIGQTGASNVQDSLDKSGKTAANPSDVVTSLSGKVTMNGVVNFVTPSTAPASADRQLRSGHVKDAQLNLVALLKQVGPDPALPNKTVESNIDVTGHVTVRALPAGKHTPAAAGSG